MTNLARTRTNGARVFTAERQKTAGTTVATRANADGGAQSGEFTPEATRLMMGAIEALRTDISKEIALLRGVEPATDADAQDEQDLAELERDRAYEELDLLKNEIRSLTFAIQRTKEEVAALYKSEGHERRMTAVTDELDTVVTATEEATGHILAAVEVIDEIAGQIRTTGDNDYVTGLAQDISEQVTKVFEASNFQDVTGQKLRKVVNTLMFVEERLIRVIEIWGEDDMSVLPGAQAPKGLDDLDRTVEQTTETRKQISQSDIDAMFD